MPTPNLFDRQAIIGSLCAQVQTFALAPRTMLVIAACLALPIAGLGCAGTPLGQHRWGGSEYGQGDVSRQAARAIYFDPYPLNDIGPEVVGGRPREFSKPLPEAVRNELYDVIPPRQPFGP